MNDKTSFARWFRNFCYISYLQNRWLTASVKQQLSKHIQNAEQGHRGEIYLVIENHLPIASAYRQDCYTRAMEIFASHYVWDTEENTGVLIYLNLCEHELHIIADRGINKLIQQSTWQALCEQAIAQLKQQQHQPAIEQLVTQIGQLLREHFAGEDRFKDELSNVVQHFG